MIWSKPLTWFLVGSSRISISSPVSSECIPYREVCYTTFPNADINNATSRLKRDDAYANLIIKHIKEGEIECQQEPTSLHPSTRLPAADEYAMKLLNEADTIKPENQALYFHSRWAIYAAALADKLKNAEAKLQLIEKPAQIRVIIDDTEARFVKPSFCENCLQYGHKTNNCSSPKASKSADPKRNRILNRKRFWKWILGNHTDDERISYLLKELKMDYDNDKPKNTTFEVYKEKFCEAIGEMYENVNSKIYAFELAERVKRKNIFGPFIDRFVDPIIRCLGDFPDPNKPPIEYEE